MTNWKRFEKERQATVAEAERLNVPGFATPTWKRRYVEPRECPSCGNLYDHRYPCVG